MRKTTLASRRQFQPGCVAPDTPPAPVSSRLSFRSWSLSDVTRLLEICADPDVMRFVGDGGVWSQLLVEQFVEDSMAEQSRLGWCRWALVERANGRLIGFCGFVATDRGPEIGWRLASDCWGRGLATEAGQAAMAFGFERLGFDCVRATIQRDNQASIRVARKLGMLQEQAIERNGREVLVFVSKPLV